MNLLDFRPEHVRGLLGANSKVCLLSSKTIINAIQNESFMVMACNIRIKHVVPGIMRAAQDQDAIVAFEIAKSEGGLDGGYTGFVPQTFWETLIGYAEEVGYTKPFFIHGDHITVKDKSEKQISEARDLIAAELKAGYTSFCIDASFNEIPNNLKITTQLAKPLSDYDVGLEVEVGEITHVGREGRLTTVEESKEFIGGFIQNGIQPNLLAIYNGSKHGNYRPGEEVHIDLKRTREVYDAVKKWNVSIAQHGITGTPVEMLHKFVDAGVRKGNVGTNWQNVAHRGLPKDLLDAMQKWVKENNSELKKTTKVFLKDINSIPKANQKQIEADAYKEATEFIQAFRAKGSASKLAQKLK